MNCRVKFGVIVVSLGLLASCAPRPAKFTELQVPATLFYVAAPATASPLASFSIACGVAAYNVGVNALADTILTDSFSASRSSGSATILIRGYKLERKGTPAWQFPFYQIGEDRYGIDIVEIPISLPEGTYTIEIPMEHRFNYRQSRANWLPEGYKPVVPTRSVIVAHSEPASHAASLSEDVASSSLE